MEGEMVNLRRFSLLGLLVIVLLTGCNKSQSGKEDPPVNIDKAKELIIGKWKYQGQDEFIELEFTPTELKAKFNAAGRSGNTSGNYFLGDDGVLINLPQIAANFGNEAKIVSITKDRMVLTSGDPRQITSPRLEFNRQQ